MDVVITFPDEQYGFGSEVEVTVHVFDFGQYSDVPEVVLVVGETGRDVNTTREGIGLFTGTIVLKAEDLDVSEMMKVSARVKHDDEWHEPLGEVDIGTVYRHGYHEELILTNFMDHWPRPGDTVHYDVLFTFMGMPVDPDPGTLRVEMSNYEWPFSGLQRVEEGHYTGSFEIPEGLMRSMDEHITIRSYYTWDNITYRGWIPLTIYVDMFKVWCEKVRGDQTGCTLELHVCDMEMGIVEGAHVELHYDLNTFEDGVHDDLYGIINGTTDGQGLVTFDIEYPGIDPEMPRIRVTGYVFHEDLKQRFETTIHVQALLPWSYYGPYRLEAQFLNPLPLPLESPVTLEMVLRDEDDDVLLADTEVGYSVFTDHEVITSGTTTSDKDGRLNLTIVTPGVGSKYSSGINMDVRITAEVDGWVEHVIVGLVCWHELGLYLDWYDDGTSLEVEQGSPGGNLSVSLSHPEADGSDEEVWFVWGLDSIDWSADITNEGRNWTRVSSMSMFGGMELITGEYSDGVYTADIPIPDFVPDGSMIYIVGVIDFHNEGGVVRNLNYVEGFTYEADIDQNNDDEVPEVSMPDWYLWILVLIIVIVAVVVVLLRVRNKDERFSSDR